MGVVSRRWMGVATGCGCKEVYRFPHNTYPYSSCICSFLQQHPYFCSLKKKWFSFLYTYKYEVGRGGRGGGGRGGRGGGGRGGGGGGGGGGLNLTSCHSLHTLPLQHNLQND